ncbi:flagellar motor switch protein FliM [Spirochaetota bacterium]|nr:flagellar motor switch protein FliM [Spirochaetota bacterium]
MTELISKSDIDNLLDALNINDDSLDSLLDDNLDEVSLEAPHKSRNIKIYDFKSPDKFSKDQLRTIQMIYENYSRSISTTLSTYLRKLVVVNVSSVDQISFEQFNKTVMKPSLLAIIDMYPLKGSSIMEIPPVLTFAILERLLGGQGDDTLKKPREFTDIELSVMESVITRLLSNLKEVWSNIIEFKPRLEGIETNIQFTQLIPLNDTLVLVTLDTRIGNVEGSILFCIPYVTLESVINRLSAKNVYITYKKEYNVKLDEIRRHLLKMNIDLVAEIGQFSLKVNEFLNLERGDCIELPTHKNMPLRVKIGGKVKYLARAGSVGKNKGIVISAVGREKKESADLIKEMKF